MSRVFRDAFFNEYHPQAQQPLRQEGHKAIWEYNQGFLLTWDSYIFGHASDQGSAEKQFNQVNTVGQAMNAYRTFEGIQ